LQAHHPVVGEHRTNNKDPLQKYAVGLFLFIFSLAVELAFDKGDNHQSQKNDNNADNGIN